MMHQLLRLPQDVEALRSGQTVNGQMQLGLAGNAGTYIRARIQL